MAAPVSTKPGWRFGVFEVDARRGELRRSGVALKLREQSFRILLALLESPGEVVTREELRGLLWPSDTFVDFDHSLNTAMMKLRDALGDSTEAPIYIETVPKRGYRFVAPVSCVAEMAPATPVGGSTGSRVVGLPTQARLADLLESAPTAFSRSLRTTAVLIGFLIFAITGCLTFAWMRHSSSRRQAKEISSYKIVPLTSAQGLVLSPAISPDGRMVAYFWDGPKRDRWELYVKFIGDELPHRVTYEGGRFGYPAWSPDGLKIAYVKCDLTNRGGVFVVSALEGPEHRITSAGCPYNFPSDLAWSSFDGGRLLFIDRCVSGGPFGLISFSLKTGARQCLTDAGPPGFERRFAFSISPDGTRIAFIPSTDAACDIDITALSGGATKRILHDNDSCLWLMWTPDGETILFSSQRTGLPSLWRVPVRGGEMRKEPLYPALGRFSADGRRFVWEEKSLVEAPSTWRVDLASPGGKVIANRKMIDTQTRELDAQPSPDGSRIAWTSERTGAHEIWIGGADGKNQHQLTHLNSYAGTPRWSPDGKWIAFDFDKGSIQIFVIDTEGRNLRQVTSGDGVNEVPNWSRDGKWIYFGSLRTGRKEIWKHNLNNGKEVQVTTHGGFDPFESFDGRTIYFSKFDEVGLWTMPSAGGEETTVIAGMPQSLYWGYWALTRTGIYFLNVYSEPRSRIEFYDFATRRTHPVFEIEKVPAWAHPSLSATEDGKTIFYGQQDFQGVVKMMEFQR